MLCLSGFELHSRWVPLNDVKLETSKKFGLDKTGTTCPVRKKMLKTGRTFALVFLSKSSNPLNLFLFLEKKNSLNLLQKITNRKIGRGSTPF